MAQNYEVDLEDSLQQLGNYVAEFQNELNRRLKQKVDGSWSISRETKETEEFHDHRQLGERMKRLSTGAKGATNILSNTSNKEGSQITSSSSSSELQIPSTPHFSEGLSPRKLQHSSHSNALSPPPATNDSSNSNTNKPKE
jgi:hypothetical protein